MARFRVTLDGRLSVKSGELDIDEARHALDVAIAEMYTLTMCAPSIDATLESTGGTVVISCAMDIEDADDAVAQARVDIRTALHAAGIGTSNWPEKTDPRWHVDFIEARSAAFVST